MSKGSFRRARSIFGGASAALIACAAGTASTTNSGGDVINHRQQQEEYFERLVLQPRDSGSGPVVERPSPLYQQRIWFTAGKDVNGVDGRVELLEDDRINADSRPRLEQWYHGAPCHPLLEKVCASALAVDLLPARVRLVDREGREIGSRVLELPFAEMAEARLVSAAWSTYLVTVDMSAGAGSTNGPITRFAEVVAGELRWVSTTDGGTGHGEELVLTSSVRSAWRLVPRADGRGQDVLEVSCPLVFADGGSSTLLFTRYSFKNGGWRRYERSEPGWWESAAAFPARAHFP